jgi:hypothetical protein
MGLVCYMLYWVHATDYLVYVQTELHGSTAVGFR